MSTYNLSHLFEPASIAVVGATDRSGALGAAILRTIRAGGFGGAIHPVNPRHRRVMGLPCHKSIRDIGSPVDLVVIVTPAGVVPDAIDDAAAASARAAIVITAGLGHGPGSIAETVRLKARASGLRIVGPNCLGVLSPRARLNASFARSLPKAGGLALVSQSGAVAAGLVEWARHHGVGFSGVVSLGDAIDVDVGDCLDHFAEDAATQAIMLYVEGVTDARKFMSAARKAARVKPVIALKAGRHSAGAKAAATHTGALAGSDVVYDAAFRRAGCIRVLDLDELFAAAETLAARPPIRGDRLAILTNGGGLGVLAVDRLLDFEGRLAELSLETCQALDAVLPATWSRANPIDIIGDADAARYAAALKPLLACPANDAILVMNCPTAVASPAEAAETIIGLVEDHRKQAAEPKPVFSVWLGADQQQSSRFESAGIASFASEADAVRGISHLFDMHRQRTALLRVARSLRSRSRRTTRGR